MSKTEKATREYLETLSKDQVIDLCLQFMFDAEISEQQLDQANERLNKETEERQHLQCDYKTLLSHYNNLKEIAIARPKFEHFEEYWYIENNPYCDNELQVFNGKVIEIICAYDEDWLYEYRFDTSCRYIEENMIFATFEEAEKKLQEPQNGDFQGE